MTVTVVRTRLIAAGVSILGIVMAAVVAAPSARAADVDETVSSADELATLLTAINGTADTNDTVTITLGADFTWDQNLVNYLPGSSGVTFNLVGDGHTVTLGDNASGFLGINEVDNVTISDLTIEGGDVQSALIVYSPWGAASLTDVVVRDVTSFMAPVLLDVNGVQIIDSTFTGNSSAEGGHPGAVAISHDSSVFIVDSTFTDNTAQDGTGGAVAVVGDSLTSLYISDSTFTDNFADEDGGAVFVTHGNVSITRSVFSANEARNRGGAIINDQHDLTIEDSEFSLNTAGSDGGATWSRVWTQTLRSTFDSNSSGGNGGAVYSQGESTGTNVRLSTFVDNDADARGGAIYVADGDFAALQSTFYANAANDGGAHLHLEGTGPFWTMFSAYAGAPGAADCTFSDYFGLSGYNFSDDASCLPDAGATEDFGNGVDAQLEPLADNGGNTRTLMPGPTSPLRDAIEAATCEAAFANFVFIDVVDQRGFNRADALSLGDPGCDLGAVERVGSISFVLEGPQGDVHFTVEGAADWYGECTSPIAFADAPPGAPAGVDFPHGLFMFCVATGVEGATITVTATYPSPVNRAYKVDEAWHDIPGVVIAGNTVTYQVQDGSWLDIDGIRDGYVVDPLAAGVAAAFTG